MRCSLCNGSLIVLGTLGQLKWLRCQCCGMQFSRKTKARKGKS